MSNSRIIHSTTVAYYYEFISIFFIVSVVRWTILSPSSPPNTHTFTTFIPYSVVRLGDTSNRVHFSPVVHIGDKPVAALNIFSSYSGYMLC